MNDTSRRILVADDDPDMGVIVSRALALLGFSSIVVHDGQQALDECQQCLPDLAIVDYMMPGLNGIELCRAVKALPGGAFVPVLMLTARDSVRDRVSAFDEGVDEYLTKPFHYEELQARVRALIRMRDLTVELKERNDELHRMQQKLIEQERQLVAGQLAGTAAHQLGQPLSAILLNCYLLENVAPTDHKFAIALAAVKSDAKRMADLIERLKMVRADEQEEYFGRTTILRMGVPENEDSGFKRS